MNNFQDIEAIAVFLIILVQLYAFYKTSVKIRLFRFVFPSRDQFTVIKAGLLKRHFDLEPTDVISNWRRYSDESIPKFNRPETEGPNGFIYQSDNYEEDQRIYIELIEKKTGGNDVTDNILTTLNTYLLRNKGMASDFHLIKDVVERNTDAIEGDINQTISLPLYLGLLGTFLGIIFGLFQIGGANFATDPSALNNAISLLLGGVKIAMIASFAGLFLTIVNSGFRFNRAKSFVEKQKNDFYTFIQIELLPLLNQNVNSTLSTLQKNLNQFNDDFKINISKLNSVMVKNHEVLLSQEKIFDILANMDIAEFAKANVKVLRELKYSTDKFAEFNLYLGAITELLNNAKEFTIKINSMVERTDSIHEVGKQIAGMFSQNQVLLKFLQSHYNSLEESQQLISSSVNIVNDTLSESLNKLKEFTQARIVEIQKLTLREIDLMQTHYPEKWKKLDNLGYLETVNNNIADIKSNNDSYNVNVTGELGTFSNKLDSIIIELKSLKRISNHRGPGVFASLFKRFGNNNHNDS